MDPAVDTSALGLREGMKRGTPSITLPARAGYCYRPLVRGAGRRGLNPTPGCGRLTGRTRAHRQLAPEMASSRCQNGFSCRADRVWGDSGLPALGLLPRGDSGLLQPCRDALSTRSC